MTIGRFSGGRDTPFFWWGTEQRAGPHPDLETLIQSQFITEVGATLLLDLIGAGLSLVVVSEASGAGKSSLLAALLAEVQTDRQRIYLRGNYETFEFLRTTPPNETMLMVNEISAHLPAYLWGPPVTALFEAKRTGYQVLATAHAASAAALLHMLTTAPLRVPQSLVNMPTIVVVLASPTNPDDKRRGFMALTGIRPGATPESTMIEPIIGFDGEVSREAVARMLEINGGG